MLLSFFHFVFLNFISNFIKNCFFYCSNGIKVANLGKTFETEKYFNIESGLLCFTFDIFEIICKNFCQIIT